MEDLDAVMRGIGNMRDHGFAPAWGPGRHGPGDNVYAYYIAPFGPVIEYSTAVEKVGEDYQTGEPDDWTWPEKRIDQWGVSDKDFAGLRVAEEAFRFRREWQAPPSTNLLERNPPCVMCHSPAPMESPALAALMGKPCSIWAAPMPA
jgi:hypothetical protein